MHGRLVAGIPEVKFPVRVSVDGQWSTPSTGTEVCRAYPALRDRIAQLGYGDSIRFFDTVGRDITVRRTYPALLGMSPTTRDQRLDAAHARMYARRDEADAPARPSSRVRVPIRRARRDALAQLRSAGVSRARAAEILYLAAAEPPSDDDDL